MKTRSTWLGPFVFPSRHPSVNKGLSVNSFCLIGFWICYYVDTSLRIRCTGATIRSVWCTPRFQKITKHWETVTNQLESLPANKSTTLYQRARMCHYLGLGPFTGKNRPAILNCVLFNRTWRRIVSDAGGSLSKRLSFLNEWPSMFVGGSTMFVKFSPTAAASHVAFNGTAISRWFHWIKIKDKPDSVPPWLSSVFRLAASVTLKLTSRSSNQPAALQTLTNETLLQLIEIENKKSANFFFFLIKKIIQQKQLCLLTVIAEQRLTTEKHLLLSYNIIT